ncbi:MAG: hypothetical protein OXG72_01155 [Acidobacteria bacterium]|nr:hypothetical protein [Acidobacteriota bacterium]
MRHRGHDAETGEEMWRRRLVPAPGEPSDEACGDVLYEAAFT